MKMTAEELREQNQLADALIAKLERIKDLWEDLPDEDEMEPLDSRLGSIVGSLKEIPELSGAIDFPKAVEFEDLDKQLGSIVRNLNEIIEKQQEVAREAPDLASDLR